jgi:hypothetical protein
MSEGDQVSREHVCPTLIAINKYCVLHDSKGKSANGSNEYERLRVISGAVVSGAPAPSLLPRCFPLAY